MRVIGDDNGINWSVASILSPPSHLNFCISAVLTSRTTMEIILDFFVVHVM